jgi:hypothetical protein
MVLAARTLATNANAGWSIHLSKKLASFIFSAAQTLAWAWGDEHNNPSDV